MKTYYIYELIDPETKLARYIGYTNDLTKRFKKHLNECKHVSTKKNDWLKSLLDKNLIPIIREIDSTTILEDVKKLEIMYIAKYKENGCDLTNSTNGGDGCHGVSWEGKKHQEISVQRMKYNHPLRKIILQFDMNNNFIQKFESSRELDMHPVFNRRSVVRCCKDELVSFKGYYFRYSDEFFVCSVAKQIANMDEIQKILDNNQITKMSNKEEQKRLNSEINKIKREENKKIKEEKLKNKKTQKIYIHYDLKGNILGRYVGLKNASKQTGCHEWLLSNCCKNKSYYTVNGTTFRYEGDEFDYQPYNKNIQKTSRKICKYKLNGEFVCEFDSIKMACIDAGISKTGANISRCCHQKYNQKTGKSIIVKGFTYRFSEDIF